MDLLPFIEQYIADMKVEKSKIITSKQNIGNDNSQDGLRQNRPSH